MAAGETKPAQARRSAAVGTIRRGLRLVLADPDALVRAALRGLCEREGWLVVAEAATGQELIGLVEAHRPDVVITEVQLRELGGLEAVERLKQSSPEPAPPESSPESVPGVVVLAARSDAQVAAWSLEAGADAFVLKTDTFDELREAVQSAARGQRHVSAAVPRQRAGENGSDVSGLSVREREVLQLLAQGASAKEIATELEISSKTVDAHRRRLMEKLRLDSIADLTRFAVREGLVRVDATFTPARNGHASGPPDANGSNR